MIKIRNIIKKIKVNVNTLVMINKIIDTYNRATAFTELRGSGIAHSQRHDATVRGIPSKDKIAGFIYIGVKDDKPNERKRPIYNEVVKFL